MEIVSGRTGKPHVTSQQFRQIIEGIISDESCILPSGENLEPGWYPTILSRSEAE